MPYHLHEFLGVKRSLDRLEAGLKTNPAALYDINYARQQLDTLVDLYESTIDSYSEEIYRISKNGKKPL